MLVSNRRALPKGALCWCPIGEHYLHVCEVGVVTVPAAGLAPVAVIPNLEK